MEVLAIIPARGGSKGLPGKNIRPLRGHPLIAYSIRASLESSCINRTIVSTDGAEIAHIAKQYGAETPFLRPTAFSQDLSTDLEVFSHALQWLRETQDYQPDYVVQLRPTSPIRPKGLIDSCIKRLLNTSADSLRIVTEAPISPFKMWRIDNANEVMTPLLSVPGIPEAFNQPRQNLPIVYWQIGTLDVIRTSAITVQRSMSGRRILPYVLEGKYAIDIDDIASFLQAEQLLAASPECIAFDL